MAESEAAPVILVVDDDDELRAELADLLEDYRVYEASSGGEALEILSRPNEIGAVILDIRMPGLDGVETLKAIRKSDPSVGVIILTGFGTKDTAVEALRNHADDYLEKPAGLDRIREAVRDVLVSRAAPGAVFDKNDPAFRTEKIRWFVKKNLFKKTTLNDAADAVFLSPKYLSRYFRQKTGRSFRDYKVDLKVKEAEKLLLGTGRSVAEIAEKLGYANVESFSRIFKKRAGASPSDFRNRSRA